MRAPFRAVLLLATSCACASGPGVREASELSLTGAAEAWTAWIDARAAEAEADPDAGSRAELLYELSRLNAQWDSLEAAFKAAWMAYEAGARAGAGSPDDRRRVEAAHSRAMAFLHGLGVLR